MPKIIQLEAMAVDLPFRRNFRHAAASRKTSESLFVKCVTDAGQIGFGESLPRAYVTGETRDEALEQLEHFILPNLIGAEFDSMTEVYQFLYRCDGQAPVDWVGSAPQSHLAAWSAVDLALLDAFGRVFHEPVRVGQAPNSSAVHYSGVLSADAAWKMKLSLLKLRLYGIQDVKLKVTPGDPLPAAGLARRILGREATIRLDANMAWQPAEALRNIRALKRFDVDCIEQPIASGNMSDLAMLVRETDAEIIVDEGFTDRLSLTRLVQWQACRGVSVRISKCGGLMAAARRCEEAQRAGLHLQIGCHVGESSLLSAAQRILLAGVESPNYVEGAYGRHLLREDPVFPNLQLGYGGRAPELPTGSGLGVEVDEAKLERWVGRRARVVNGTTKKPKKGNAYVVCS